MLRFFKKKKEGADFGPIASHESANEQFVSLLADVCVKAEKELCVSVLLPFAFPAAMLYFPSLRVYNFTVFKKCFDTRGRSTQWLVGSCIDYFILIESVLNIVENFLYLIFFVFVTEQGVPKTKWFQASVFSKSISWTYLQSYSPYLLVL